MKNEWDISLFYIYWNDKNKTKKVKEIAKNNQSNTISFSNNSIQNLAQLSKANNHNLRKYDNQL